MVLLRIVISASAMATAILVAAYVGWMVDQTMPNTTSDGDHTSKIPAPVDTDTRDTWIEWYRTVEFDGLDHHTRDIILVLHDFEVDFHPDLDHDISWEVVALMAQRDMLGADYAPTANEELLHEWLIAEHEPPADMDLIDMAILEIVGSQENMYRADMVYEAAMFGASIGYVPDDLHMSDMSYWGREQFIAACDLVWEDCDPEEMRASIEAELERRG